MIWGGPGQLVSVNGLTVHEGAVARAQIAQDDVALALHMSGPLPSVLADGSRVHITGPPVTRVA